MRWTLLILVLLWATSGCSSASRSETGAAQAAVTLATATPLPTPTMPPTALPGTSADLREARAVAEQFGDAVAHDDELVALLSLSPKAQKVVADSGLNLFLGQADRPTVIQVQGVRIDGDVAMVQYIVHYASGDKLLQLRLVRLAGQWRVDGRVDQ